LYNLAFLATISNKFTYLLNYTPVAFSCSLAKLIGSVANQLPAS